MKSLLPHSVRTSAKKSTIHSYALQITKLNVKLLNESDCVQHYPTSTVTDLLMNLESSQKSDHLNQLTVDVEENYIDPKSLYYGAIYEVEVWLKYGKIRRKLDLVAKCHPKKTSNGKRGSVELEIQEENEDEEHEKQSVLHLSASQERLFEADRDYIAHDTVVQDMCAYLRKKGINNPEEMLSLPVRYLQRHVKHFFACLFLGDSLALLQLQKPFCTALNTMSTMQYNTVVENPPKVSFE